MPLPIRRPEHRTVVASAAGLSTRAESSYAKRLAQPWQQRALAYYEQVGELRYASHFYARQLARVRYYPALLRDDGSTEPIESGLPVDLLSKLQDPAGGRSRLQYDYGRLMFITGEGVLFGDQLEDTSGKPERWRFLWREEVKVEDNGTTYRVAASEGGGQGGEKIGGDGIGYRLWTPSPRHSDLADSPMRAVLDIAEELLILTAAVRGTATTRLTNGVLVIPSEISPNPDVVGRDEDAESNIFLAKLIEHMTAQIENPSAAEAKAPYLMEATYEYLDRVKWIPLHDPQTDYMERDLRLEAIKRMALGLDMPPEVLLGMTDANHWTAKQVQHDMWRSHGIAVAERMADDLNEAYLRPRLQQENYGDADSVVIDYDDSQVVISPDRTQDADNAADRGMISDEGYRELKGIDPSMKPSKEEKDLWVAIKLKDPAIAGLESTPPPAQVIPNANGNAAAGPPEPTGNRTGSRQEAQTASISGAAVLALRHCRSRAGARLRSAAAEKFRGKATCEECLEATDGLPNSLVASTLGPQQVTRLANDPLSLVAGGTREFRSVLVEWGIDEGQATSLCSRIEQYAAKTLCKPEQPELPEVLLAQIEDAQKLSAVA